MTAIITTATAGQQIDSDENACVLWYRGPNGIDWDLCTDEQDAADLAAAYAYGDRPMEILGAQFPDRTVPVAEWTAFRDAYSRRVNGDASPEPQPVEPVRHVADPFTGADVPVFETDAAPSWLGLPRG